MAIKYSAKTSCVNVPSAVCLLLFCLTKASSYLYKLKECDASGHIDIVENQQTSITCEFRWMEKVYWSITRPATDGVEKRIGGCEFCYPNCTGTRSPFYNCSSINNNFTITSVNSNSFLRFVRGLMLGDTAIIKCSKEGDSIYNECNVDVIKDYRLPDCENDTLEVVDNGKTSILCAGIPPTHSIHWNITYPNGQKIKIGDCSKCYTNGTCPKCTVPHFDLYEVHRTPENSTLKLKGGHDKSKDGAMVKCYKTDERFQARCWIKVQNYRIPQCNNGFLDVPDSSKWVSMRCEDLETDHDMKWTITSDIGDFSQAAVCNTDYKCDAAEGFTATRLKTSVSELRLVGRVRERGNHKLTCQREDGAAAVSCHLRVIYPAELENPTVSIGSDFKVSGRVDISKVFVSDSNVTCTWLYTQGNTTSKVDGNLTLQTFTDEDNSLSYQRGVCDMELHVNTTLTSYNFTVDIHPGSGPLFVGTILIKKPGNVTLDETSCPDYVAEGSDVSCTCAHPPSERGRPAAIVQWENVTDTAVLEVHSVGREQSGTQFVCTSVWASGTPHQVTSSVSYTLTVAYGPSSARVTKANTTGDLPNLIFTCTYDEAFPSVRVYWTAACTSEVSTANTSTCSLAAMTDVDKVVCTVVNSKIGLLRASDSYRFSSDGDSIALRLAAVAAGSAVGGMLITIAVVVVVIFIRRRRKHEPENVPPQTKTEPECDVSTESYDGLQMSDIGLRSSYSELVGHDNNKSVSVDGYYQPGAIGQYEDEGDGYDQPGAKGEDDGEGGYLEVF